MDYYIYDTEAGLCRPMKAGVLRGLLKDVPGHATVLVSMDPEGNGLGELYMVSCRSLTVDLARLENLGTLQDNPEFAKEDPTEAKGANVIVLWPG